MVKIKFSKFPMNRRKTREWSQVFQYCVEKIQRCLTYLIPKCVQIPIHYLDIDFQVLAYMYCPYIGSLTSERIFPFLYTYKLWQWFLCLKMDKKRHFRHQFFHISNGGSKLYRINYDAKIVEFYGFAIKKLSLWLSDEKKLI